MNVLLGSALPAPRPFNQTVFADHCPMMNVDLAWILIGLVKELAIALLALGSYRDPRIFVDSRS
jgi:hypothetical protein